MWSGYSNNTIALLIDGLTKESSTRLAALRISLILSGVHHGRSKVVSLVDEHIVNCNKHKAYTESF
jgi:hypothetical protein